MKNIKKTLALLAALSVGTVHHIAYSMQKSKKKYKSYNLTHRIGNVLTGNAPIQSLWKNNTSFDFITLPTDIQEYITQLLMNNSIAKNLKEAAKAITSLSHVNKSLYASINDKKNFINLLQNLSYRFNVPQEEAASALGIKAAKKYLIARLKTIDESNKADLALLKNPTININIKDEYGNTPLINAVNNNQINIINALLRNKRLNINAQNNEGNTALHIALTKVLNATTPEDEKLNKLLSEKLIKRGSHTRIQNRYHITPTHLAIQTNDKDILFEIKWSGIEHAGI